MKKERNYASIICNMFAIATLIVSLSNYRWFWLQGGICNMKYIGLNMFITIGRLYISRKPVSWNTSSSMNEIYQFKPNDYTNLIGCVDPHSILILRLIITLIFLVIISSTIGLILDVFAPIKSGLKCMRRYAFWHLFSVLLCTLAIGFCFYVSELIFDIQDQTRTKIGKKIEVQYGFAYYLLILSNGFLFFSTAINLLRKYPTNEEEEEDIERLIDDWSRREQSLFIERSLPATNDPPPDYHSEDDFLIV